MDRKRFELEKKELEKRIEYNFLLNINNALENNNIEEVYNYVMSYFDYEIIRKNKNKKREKKI